MKEEFTEITLFSTLINMYIVLGSNFSTYLLLATMMDMKSISTHYSYEAFLDKSRCGLTHGVKQQFVSRSQLTCTIFFPM